MDVANWAQYFNDVVLEVHRKTDSVIKPEGSLVFTNHGTPTTDFIYWSWRVLKRIPEEVVAGIGLTLKPDPLGLGSEVFLTVFAHKGEERRDQISQIHWACFVDSEYIKYDFGNFKGDLTEEIAFQLRRACEYVIMIAPRLGEVGANTEKIKAEMKILNFTLHRA